MRALLATTVAACVGTAALVLPMAYPAPAPAASRPGAAPAAGDPHGTTRVIPLTPLPAPAKDLANGPAKGLTSRPAGAVPATGRRAAPAPDALAGQGLTSRTVRPFSLLGITWDDSAARLDGTVQVRTRARATGVWSGWQTLYANDDVPDLDSPERSGTHARGGTAPLWVGDANGVQVRVTPRRATSRAAAPATLPRGLRVDLVDPGAPAAASRARALPPPAAAPAPAVDPAAPAVPPATGRLAPATRPGARVLPGALPPAAGLGVPVPPLLADILAPARALPVPARLPARLPAPVAPRPGGGPAHPHPGAAAAASRAPATLAAPRPRITTRSGWGADEKLRERLFAYTGPVRAVFVHHTVTGNGYSCAQAPAVIRGIYRYHVVSEGWRDIGYNFLIDKCGTIYEGRAGGVTQAVLGAHTLGFNNDSSGIALLGTFSKAKPSTAAVRALESLAAWKLGLSGVRADGTTVLVSKGSDKFPAGHHVRFPTISGHRDAFTTECPGTRLYAQLPAIRRAAAALQTG